MAAFQAPPQLREFITDDQWSDRVGNIVRFDTLPLRRRLDFIDMFAHKFDWSDVGFGSLLETAELNAIAGMIKGAILRQVTRARAHLDAGNTDGAHAALLELMRATPIGQYAHPSETKFGDLGARSMTLLGDIIAWEWARASPAMEHARLCNLASEMLGEGMSPGQTARAVMDDFHHV